MVLEWIGHRIIPSTCTCVDGRKPRRQRPMRDRAVAEVRAEENPRRNDVHPRPCSHRYSKWEPRFARDVRTGRDPWLGASQDFPSVVQTRSRSSPFERTRTFHTLMHVIWTRMASTSTTRVLHFGHSPPVPIHSRRGFTSAPPDLESGCGCHIRPFVSSSCASAATGTSRGSRFPGSFPFQRTTRSHRSDGSSRLLIQQTRPIDVPSPDEGVGRSYASSAAYVRDGKGTPSIRFGKWCDPSHGVEVHWQHARVMEDESVDKETQEVENEAQGSVEDSQRKGKEVQSEEPKVQGRSLMQIVTLLDQMAEDVCKLVVDKDADEAIESLESKLEVIDFACEKAEKEALDEESYLLLSQLAKILQYLNGQLVQDRDEQISQYFLVRAGNGLEVRTFDPNAQRDAFPQRREVLRQAMQGGGSYVYPAHSAMAYQPYNVQQTQTQVPAQYPGYFPGTHAMHYVSEGGMHNHEPHLPTPSYTAPTHINMNAQMLLGQTRGRMQYGMMQHTPYGYQLEPQLQLGLPSYSQGQQFQNPPQMHGFQLTGYPQNFVPQWNQTAPSSMQQPQPQVIPVVDQRKGPGHHTYSPYLQK